MCSPRINNPVSRHIVPTNVIHLCIVSQSTILRFHDRLAYILYMRYINVFTANKHSLIHIAVDFSCFFTRFLLDYQIAFLSFGLDRRHVTPD